MLHPVENTFILQHCSSFYVHVIEFASRRYSFRELFSWGNLFKVPQFEPTFQDFLEFLKGSFVLNIQRPKMEPFTVSR
jgi:hypothetical protein